MRNSSPAAALDIWSRPVITGHLIFRREGYSPVQSSSSCFIIMEKTMTRSKTWNHYGLVNFNGNMGLKTLFLFDSLPELSRSYIYKVKVVYEFMNIFIVVHCA